MKPGQMGRKVFGGTGGPGAFLKEFQMRYKAAFRLIISMLFALTGFAAIPLSGVANAQAAPVLELVTPAAGATINANDIVVQVNVSNFTIDCAQSGRPDQDNTGQILALVDGTAVAQLANIYCTTTFVVPGNGLTPGEHQLAVVLASNTHVPLMDTAQVVTINYQPVEPLPLPVANYTDTPGVTLVSPQDGDTVAPQFEVQVQPQNFAPTTDLEGKTNVAGYGHYHVWVDTAEMPTSLAGLVLMPGTNAFTLDLSAWGPGEHQVRIETAQNDHTMYDPAVAASFTVTVSEEATTPVASPAAESDSASAQGDVTIEMTNELRFSPDNITITKGQTVTWVNSSDMPHTATGDPAQNPVADQFPDYATLPAGAEAWDSGILQPGESFSYTFDVEGTYNYFCLPHVLAGMTGTITVQG
jgi:plastocyanin